MAGPTGPPIAPPPGGGGSYQQQQQQWDGQEGFPLPPQTPLKETVQRYVLVLVSACGGWTCVRKDPSTCLLLPSLPYSLHFLDVRISF